MSKKLCEVCRERPATVPDRNKMPGRLINRVCSECHAARLRGDLTAIMEKREAALKRLSELSQEIGQEL